MPTPRNIPFSVEISKKEQEHDKKEETTQRHHSKSITQILKTF